MTEKSHQYILNGHSCPFCEGDNLRRSRVLAHDAPSKNVSIIECRTCKAGWQWPLQQTESQSVVEFENNYVEHAAGSYFDPVKRDSVAGLQCTFLQGIVPIPGRFLDIGCGDGSLCRAMALAGWSTLGLDPALPAQVDQSFGSGHLKLLRTGLSDLAKSELFDVVTLWDVVEHVEQPLQLITLAADYLAPGGQLVIETGNYQSEGRVMNPDSWWNFQVDHRWYLAPPQLGALLSQAGLGGIKLIDHVLRPWWKGNSGLRPQSMRTLVKTVLKKPWKFAQAVRSHQELNGSCLAWKDWGGLEIMTMVGRKR